MEFRILGSTEVLDGSRRVPLPTGRGRALLALLILQAGQPVSRERLIDELWGEHPPPTAGTVIHGLVSRLRRALEPGRRKGEPARILQTVGSGYRLAIDPDAVDADRFKRLFDEAQGAAPEPRSATLSAALDLWRGPALADFTYEPFAQQAIRSLEELRIEAIEDRIEAELALGRGGELVAELEQFVAAHPFRERLRSFLMLALYRAGRQTAALDVFRRTRSLLVDEMGLEPGLQLRELEAAILRQDPALEPRPSHRAGAGATRASTSWLPHERKPVTVVAVDVAPAAEPAGDPEAVGRLGARAATVAAEVLERHGARVERFLGEMLMGFLGFPVAHEDDALRAMRAALDVRTAVGAFNDDPSHIEGLRSRSRFGIDSGDIVVSGPGAELRDVVAGTVVTSAARLQQAAGEGEILVGPAAQRLLRGLVILKPVDVLGPEGGRAAAWRVLEIVSRAPPVPRVFDAPMVGRQNELTRLRAAFRRAVRSGTVARTTIIGEAGIGKSRLAKELLASLGTDSHAITVRCPPYADPAAFLPLRQAVIEAAGLHGWRGLHDLLAGEGSGRLVGDIAEAIGLSGTPENVDLLIPAFRRLLETLASERSLIVVLEDLHWAETTLLDLIDHLTREATGRIFLVCVARPELIERRPQWASNDALHLEPLCVADLESLVIDRAGSIDPGTLHRIIELSKGNPLFAEQLLAALDEGDVDAVPPSLRGLLAMRLDRLGPGERDLLRCASIVGTEFQQDAVSALLPDGARPFIQRHLGSLERKRLIEHTGTNAFQFTHLLVQLTAYQSIRLEDRAWLHERLAQWLERQSPDTPPGLDEILGHHLRQAVEHRRASGKTMP